MPFPFTFRFPVPGLFNPFTALSQSSASSDRPDILESVNRRLIQQQRGLPPASGQQRRRRPSPSPSRSLSPLAPQIPRKRGWSPSLAEPSRSATTLASTTGYLDTPAKYRNLAAADSSAEDFHEIEEADAELPPAKRRRGLAGSIVSGALSAALIGAAVGVTVYRLWRDHGKGPEQIAPPPYQETEYPVEQPKAITVTPPTPRGGRKARYNAASSVARRTHRKQRSHLPPAHAQTTSTPSFLNNAEQPEMAEEQVEDQMDWIGGKLAMLIEEGKKALGREVVVMGETAEDEVDDGNDAWEDEADGRRASSSRTASPRRKRQRPLHNVSVPPPPPSYSSNSASASPRRARFDFNAAPSASSTSLSTPSSAQAQPLAISRSMPGTSYSSPVSSFKEDASSWTSPEIRDLMERARANALKSRGEQQQPF